LAHGDVDGGAGVDRVHGLGRLVQLVGHVGKSFLGISERVEMKLIF
jgi:hypothetical protein